MAIHNSEIAAIFNEMADLLEIQDANPFRVRAYRNAAQIINGLSRNVSDLLAEGEDLTEIPGIGDDLANKIKTIIKTGELPQLKAQQKRIPSVLSQMLKIEGLGPKRVKLLYKKLNIRSMKELEEAINTGRLLKLKGMGEKTIAHIKAGMANLATYQKKYRLLDVMPIVASLTKYLQKISGVEKIECAGSFRRRKEVVGDLDFLVVAKEADRIIDKFMLFEEVAERLEHGKTRAAVRLHSGIKVDLRVVPAQSYGATLLYFTGSKSHNIALRKIALKKKLKINEYGVFKGKKSLGGKTETEMYGQIGLPYIEPELREDRGEIKAAQEGKLPKLITLQDIRGDLHCHTKATDGKDTLEEMVQAAIAKGYEYLAITDHSKHLAMVHGLDKNTLIKQIKAIDKINEKQNKIVILKSLEIDILEDGTLDLPDSLLKELDLMVCSIHSKFNLSLKKQTERIIRAMDNPYFNILGHPTGRLINQRPEYQVDIEKIMKAAKQRGCFLEINAQPDRLDLDDVQCKLAKEIGVKLAISTDGHTAAQFDYMQFGLYQGRRGWLEAGDVINTRGLKELRAILKRR